MRAALVETLGEPPVYGSFAAPEAQAGEVVVQVAASAISQLTRGRAAGTHYSKTGAVPFVPGVDGVGRLADGRRVYFAMPRAPYGGMAEQVAVPLDRCVALPDGIDDVAAAAMANPGMSSWAALTRRARFKAGETVLVNGATGSSGRLAVQIARHLGAAKVIATGRNEAVLETLGADHIIPLRQDADALEHAFRAVFAERVDVVLDYLWGESVRALLIAAAKEGEEGVSMRFVQIGSASGAEIALPGAVLRATAIEMMGSGIGSVPVSALLASIGEMFEAAVASGFTIATRAMPLSDVAAAWAEKGDADRIVLTV